VKAIAAIALLALRNAMRSRVILVLFLLLLTAGILLPLTVRSDGTPDGLIRIHLAYTLGIASFLLTLSTLWAGCAALSQEAEEKTLQLLIVKPVPRLSIWLGKWIALLLINAVLLSLVGLTTALTLQIKLHHAELDPQALDLAKQTTLASLQTRHSPLPDIEAEVQAEVEALRKKKAIPPEISKEALFESIRRPLLAKQFAVAPSQEHRWEVPQTVLFSNVPPDATEATVTLINHGTHQATLFFDPANGLVLRQPMGTFAGNYLRALAQLYLRLALFAAIGITLGTLFSMPVASFITLVLLLVLQLSTFVSAAAQTDRADFVATMAPFGANEHTHGDTETEDSRPSILARGTAYVLFYTYRGTYVMLRPLLEDQSLEALSTGTRIPPRNVLRNVLQQGLFLPLLLALFSTAVLRRREWALPSGN